MTALKTKRKIEAALGMLAVCDEVIKIMIFTVLVASAEKNKFMIRKFMTYLLHLAEVLAFILDKIFNLLIW